MSFVGRELERYISWIEGKERDLHEAVAQFASDTFSPGGEGWSEAQYEFVRVAISRFGDSCGRSLDAALQDVHRFHEAVRQAIERP